MDYFQYKGPKLYCEDTSLSELATHFGTPLYVYSYATLARHYRVYQEALGDTRHCICYAVKANSNLAILKALANLGSGADVVSGGELYRALEAGIPPQKIVFSGVGKTVEEIGYALQKKIKMINVESPSELHLISEIAKARGQKAPVSIRLNPDVDPKTHAYIATGLRKNKFGLPKDEAMSLYVKAKNDSNLDPRGLDLHIGSQITDLEPFVDSVKIAVEMVRELRRLGLPIEHLDVGGGLGVRYTKEAPPSPEAYARSLVPLVENMDLELILEPGRSLVGNAGILLTKVLYQKSAPEKEFVIVDAAMNDLLRPSLYEATHEIVPVTKKSDEKTVVDVVGPICETGDFLAKDIELEKVFPGDLLCIRTAGAYGFTMSSQYNARPRAAEVLVNGAKLDLIRKREDFEDLTRGEVIPDWLVSGEYSND